MIGGYNQRPTQGDEQTPAEHKWCCACYAGASAMARMREEDVDKTRVCGWHRCEGCRCFIHTSIMCREVRNGEAEGKYLCGHCHEVAGFRAPPAAGVEDRLPDDEQDDDDSEDVLKRGKRHGAQQGQQQRAGKKQRCGYCKKIGHNKKTCTELK